MSPKNTKKSPIQPAILVTVTSAVYDLPSYLTHVYITTSIIKDMLVLDLGVWNIIIYIVCSSVIIYLHKFVKLFVVTRSNL